MADRVVVRFAAAACTLSAPVTDTIGTATKLEVKVREPATKHTVTMWQIQRSLDEATPSPNERVKKDRLKALLSLR